MTISPTSSYSRVTFPVENVETRKDNLKELMQFFDCSKDDLEESVEILYGFIYSLEDNLEKLRQ